MLYEWEGWSIVVEELHILWTKIRILNLLSSVILFFFIFQRVVEMERGNAFDILYTVFSFLMVINY